MPEGLETRYRICPICEAGCGLQMATDGKTGTVDQVPKQLACELTFGNDIAQGVACLPHCFDAQSTLAQANMVHGPN